LLFLVPPRFTVAAAPAKKAKFPPHPRLMLLDGQIPKIKARFEESDAFKVRYDELLTWANEWLDKPIDLPTSGGQWPHWYACKKDNSRLKTVTPTEHKCPSCAASYSGWPYDDVVIYQTHVTYARAVQELGLAHRLSGEPAFAQKAREILLAYANAYSSYALHDVNDKPNVGGGRVTAQSLDEASWLIQVAQGADLIWNALSAADREKIEAGLLRPAVATIRQHKMAIHPNQCWKNSAVGLVGLLLGDGELIADAVTSEHGIQRQLAEGINEDGQWSDGAWDSHFYAMAGMAPLVEAGDRCGLGLYEYQDHGRNYRKMLEAGLDLAMPNLDLPRFTDNGQVSVKSYQGLYELGLAHYSVPRLARAINPAERTSLEALLYGVVALPQPTRETGSHNYTGAGYAVLRQGEGDESTWLSVKYGPQGGTRGRSDRLSFVLYSRGRVLGFDPGPGNKNATADDDWPAASLAHNTLTVDEASQQPSSGRCLSMQSKPGWAAAVHDAGDIYEGVTYRRAIAIIGADLVLVLDLVRATESHTIDLAYHNLGKWSAELEGRAAPLSNKAGYRSLEGMRKTSGPLPIVECESARVGLDVVGMNGGEIWAGTGPGSVRGGERMPCVLYRTSGKGAVVAWALDLTGSVPKVRVQSAASGWTVQAQSHGKNYRMTLRGTTVACTEPH
jgi:hypothetical protein